jgi:hypothetical protein
MMWVAADTPTCMMREEEEEEEEEEEKEATNASRLGRMMGRR